MTHDLTLTVRGQRRNLGPQHLTAGLGTSNRSGDNNIEPHSEASHMTIFEDLGVRTIINAKGPATRLSGGIMRMEVAAAMVEASQACVDIALLQGAASARIAEATGAEAGYVASGASACLLLSGAACMTGLDPGRMARLPDTTGMRNECVMVRSQRNFYDHIVRDEDDLNRIRRYIIENPLHWDSDEHHPRKSP